MRCLVPERRRGGTVVAIGAALLALAPRPAAAIPVFARVYGKPCSACHTIYPQLNPEGERFRDRGLHGYPPVIAPWRVAPGLEVPGTLPLALSLTVGEDVSKVDVPGRNDRTEEHTNLEFLGLLAGGELGPHLAFLADFLVLGPATCQLRAHVIPEEIAMTEPASRFRWIATALLVALVATAPAVPVHAYDDHDDGQAASRRYERGSAYNTEYFFATTRAVNEMNAHPGIKITLIPVTLVLDVAFLPFAMVAGFFG